ncbi:hypothetical protein J6590_021591 [Homalodisca vitripennis]|nr:hypothetical protein J6590_021591 [Homalodisca vitripennis]
MVCDKNLLNKRQKNVFQLSLKEPSGDRATICEGQAGGAVAKAPRHGHFVTSSRLSYVLVHTRCRPDTVLRLLAYTVCPVSHLLATVVRPCTHTLSARYCTETTRVYCLPSQSPPRDCLTSSRLSYVLVHTRCRPDTVLRLLAYTVCPVSHLLATVVRPCTHTLSARYCTETTRVYCLPSQSPPRDCRTSLYTHVVGPILY